MAIVIWLWLFFRRFDKEDCMSISDWPADQRPREKLLASGAKALSDAELLAIFLRTGVKGASAVELAGQLLVSFGGLRQIFEADQQQFCQGKGLGAAKFCQLQAVIEMNRRYLAHVIATGDVMSNSDKVEQYLIAQLRHHKRELFACLFLDNKYSVVGFDVLFKGTINAASVYPREVVKKALSYNAAAVIFSHNHPSGVAEPSLADRQITDKLKQALALVDIDVLDHIVIGNGKPVSFARRGWL